MIIKVFRNFLNGLRWVAITLLSIATVLTCINAFGRYVFNYVIFGSEEFCTYSVIIMVFLLFPVMEAEGRNIKVDILENMASSKKLKNAAFIIRGLFTIGICGAVAYYGWRVTRTAYIYQSASPTLKIPKDVVFAITAGSFSLAVLIWICILLINKRRHF